jgi:hypothetical protein
MISKLNSNTILGLLSVLAEGQGTWWNLLIFKICFLKGSEALNAVASAS